ncbi:MAG: metallophosphoesterase family protein [Candidatus Methanoperedens sp.]|nr:metallophosphoesterase family protein [Candidatus Methanoperedens sp.]
MTESRKSSTNLIVSDIHADIKALNTIIEIIADPEFIKKYGSVNKIINLGDTIGRGYYPVEVILRLIELGNEISLYTIMGNHDEAFLFNWPISGDDEECIKAHEDFKIKSSGNKSLKTCIEFLKDLPQYYLDEDEKILAVHGGPLDPEKIAPPGIAGYNKWPYQRTWQRISEHKYEYLNDYGYHYIPDNAFLHARDFFDGNFMILCGHQHTEAIYKNNGVNTERVSLDHMRVRKENLGGHEVHVKELDIDQNMNYLVRVGIGGPAGYYKKDNWNTTHFGLLWEGKKQKKIGLLNSELDY